jgi:ferredoxin-thioredoxin reductase catalytic subunit
MNDITIKLACDKEYANKVLKAIAANDGHCPCAIERTEETKCFCLIFREMESGECPCGLYMKSLR